MDMSIREAREALTRLEEIIEREGEITVTRHGRPVARIVPLHATRPVPSHADLRRSIPRQHVPSEVLLRGERDER